MRIALINPNYKGALDSKRVYIPLGLAYIAAVLRESKRHEIKVIDAAALNLGSWEVEKMIKEFRADIVAVGAATEMMEAVLNVCRIAKKNGLISVIGGPHPTILPYETIAFDEVDIIVIGEAEYTFLELMDFLENKKDLRKVEGIIFKNKNKAEVVKTALREPIKNLDELPFPARDLFPWKLYSSYTTIIRKNPAMHMTTSRGCPFHCTFCGSHALWKGCRSRGPKNVVDEIEYLIKNFKTKEIYLMDDTFNLDLKRCEEICDEIIKRKIKISLRVQARVAPLTMNLLKKMKRAGVWCIYYGVESGNQEVLNGIKKGTNIEQIKNAFKMTEKVGIRTFGFFMIGLPNDTKETIQDTFDLAFELNPDIVNFTILVPYPGTEVYELAIKEGSLKRIKPKEIFAPPRYKNKNVSDEELQKKLEEIFKKFYLRLHYMLRRLSRIRTLTELKSNILSGLPILRGKSSFIVDDKWIAPVKGKI